MSRSTRLRTRPSAPDTPRAPRKSKKKEELDTYGLVEENGGRPFQLIEGLPSSESLPQYKATLTHPLSVRDSAVLYSSMLSSRRTWISSEMFDMLWSKQFLSPGEKERLEQEGIDPESVDASAAREKMHKLCDCVMFGGPHAFSIRMFIVKNEETEKKWNDAIEQKKRRKEDRKKQELEDKKMKQELRKQQQWGKKQDSDSQSHVLELKSSVVPPVQAPGTAAQALPEAKKPPVKRRPRKEENLTPARSRSHTPQQRRTLHQSSEDQKMITNLNLMAQKNAELNSLMVIVAGGRATSQQVEEFKKYIEKARKMPSPPGWKPATPPTAAPLTQNRIDAQQRVVQANVTDRKIVDTSRPIIPPELPTSRPPERPPIKTETQSSLSPNGTPANGEAVPRQKRKYTKRKNVDTVPEQEDKSMQLTTFQLKYMDNADIVFEYVENPNKRYSFPKDAILEPLEDGESYLMSWILIHNRKEVEKYKEKRNKKLAAAKGNKDEDQKVEEEYNVFEDPQCPEPLYTAMTVKLTNIHKKFQTIMINSVNPADKVRKQMSAILERGTRLTGYNLWFQLDAYDDSELAENLRGELKDYEAGFRSKRQRKQF
ncbi:LAFA_0A02234g1_1 [Lachancea sp. 'fantastica']|nr:LAFA_0A02234g1_1 [Lachancea sp. 'fantastica']